MQSAEQSSEREERSGVRPNIRPVYEDGVFGQIRKLTHGFRTGLMLVLGAVAGAGTGCAHHKIQIPPSKINSVRTICIISEASDDIHDMPSSEGFTSGNGDTGRIFVDEIRRIYFDYITKFLEEKFSNFQTKYLGVVDTKKSKPKFENKNSALVDFLKENIALFLNEDCDDIIGFYLSVNNEGMNPMYIQLKIKQAVLNVESGLAENEETDFFVEVVLRFGATVYEDIYQPKMLASLLSEALSEAVDYELKTFNPTGRLPLSPAIKRNFLTKYLFGKIEYLYSPFTNSSDPLPNDKYQELQKLIAEYASRFPGAPNSARVNEIFHDINNRIVQANARKELLKKLRSELHNVQEVKDFANNLSTAKRYHSQGNYDEAYKYYERAATSWAALANLYNNAGLTTASIPSAFHRMADEVVSGRDEILRRFQNVERPKRQSTGSAARDWTFEDGVEDIGEGLRVLPEVIEAGRKAGEFVEEHAPGSIKRLKDAMDSSGGGNEEPAKRPRPEKQKPQKSKREKQLEKHEKCQHSAKRNWQDNCPCKGAACSFLPGGATPAECATRYHEELDKCDQALK